MAIEIVDLTLKMGGSFHSYVNVYQRVVAARNVSEGSSRAASAVLTRRCAFVAQACEGSQSPMIFGGVLPAKFRDFLWE
jgi:hypothetical protein